MALSLKDKETDRLAREVAALTGETLTEAIRRALAERLERERLRRGGTAQLAERRWRSAAIALPCRTSTTVGRTRSSATTKRACGAEWWSTRRRWSRSCWASLMPGCSRLRSVLHRYGWSRR